MDYVRPRLNDYHNLPFTQEEVDFAIPFVTEDIPLIVDPFLLWKSPSMQDHALHTAITNCFNYLGHLAQKGRIDEAAQILITSSECNEVGLGDSCTRKGKPIGQKIANEILNLFRVIPQLGASGFIHFEELQLFVDQVAKDRICDFTCSFAKSFLIDFTMQNCRKLNIPCSDIKIMVYDYRSHSLKEETVLLPCCPTNCAPILFVPKRWLRYNPWITYDDYFDGCYTRDVLKPGDPTPPRIEVLEFNRHNYDVVSTYIRRKELTKDDCRNDPLFKAIPVLSAKRHLKAIQKLPTGKTDNADKDYETVICPLLSSMLYPELDFAQAQSRTDSGVQIRDLIFYSNRSHDFLRDLYDTFDSRQIVMELKNVKQLEREHITQVNRYLQESFGNFAVIVTRNPPTRAIFKNTLDLWSGQRKCILILDDTDIEMMCQLYDSKQRSPIDVLKKKYVEFTRACPG